MNKMILPIVAMTSLLSFSVAAKTVLSQDELREKGFAGSVELGFNKTTGNSETTAYRTRISVDHFLIGWRNSYVVETDYKEDEEKTSEERYFAAAQGNREWQFAPNSYTFFRYSYENDRFNGLEDAHTISAGYGQRVVETETLYLDLEGGPGYRTNDANEASNEWILRLAGNLGWDISDNASFTEKLSSEIGQYNTITRSESALTADIIGSLALKLAFTATYQTDPSANSDDDSLEKLDTRTSVTVLYKF
jgi:putative salt-induced outer membrane protein